ncbi:hypothetical protein TNCV_2616091 [Trichonephila clavipes]|nr:hypothetical protein TNCV_2616091 [Trichonephila clavipes]
MDPSGGQRRPNSLPFFPTSREDLWLDFHFRVPPCSKGTIHLQSSMPSPRFEPKPYGTVISIANHYSGWAANG